MTKEERKIYDRHRYLKNKEKVKKRSKQYRLDNKENLHEYHKQYNQDNKEKRRKYHAEWRLKNIDKRKQYYLDNKEKFNRYGVLWAKEKYHSDSLYKFKMCLRGRTRKAFKSKSWRKRGSTEKLLGCDYETAFNH